MKSIKGRPRMVTDAQVQAILELRIPDQVDR